MMAALKITEEKAFSQDVKTMSYDELMATIRYLDTERNEIAQRVHGRARRTEMKKEVKTIKK